ncbi:dTDP-4-dehydrorhamnose reductase [Sphingomonas sp. SORGH_AS802]|uniref:family 1 glycosylhydrolase n=1 Tax=unclassified Sphingomonas TaxID=196159 RepID=UPI002856AEA9|nr:MULTISPECIES: family 1 glycosylhydrolase [unclassified Sphingomonas]MDR6125917.1 dTDP-4-dehydrorhamnose reductase [Sphingomonas sp. SORGH_AS_0438]MDR6134524.1 dTDP-4-dehydrorhamnose reductase [Sphingomonas sp. SORGH_AS_0802]
MGIELWAGAECTVNRVGNRVSDQIRRSGHHDRVDDIDRFADLGITALRFPVLWERVRGDSSTPDWAWSDPRLNRLLARGVRPIVGLIHHGSGPAHTNLLDPGFANGLAAHASAVAERYPWVTEWTPVNEPLTTARFSALYGHWYPHRRDEASFWRALLTQVDATRVAMRAVRAVNPTARLIQTDDLGRTYATVKLAGQASFDNLRRWAGWDLLFGRVTPHHPLWARLDQFGLCDRLRAIADDPCPPDVVGVNHYLTSDRFLDHRIERYPVETHGSNGRIAYADVEAVRVLDPPPAGLSGVLREAWQRYGTMIALTEVHNGCTREEQLRWVAQAWDTAVDLRGEGVDIAAVTAWALLGSHDWNTLLTAPGRYESGVFDVAAGVPRPTALATLWRGLPDGDARHAVVAQPGWWQRSDRLTHRAILRPAGFPRTPVRYDDTSPLLICGATGTLGRGFARACAARGIACVVTDRAMLDMDRSERIAAVLDEIRPWGVVNATGWVRVDEAEVNEAACHRINATDAIALATASAARGIRCLSFSSDMVFDGTATRPYVESDPVFPLNAYGRSKAAMERGCAALPGGMVVRTAAFFSPFDSHNFVRAVLDSLVAGRRFAAARDHIVTPTYVPALVDAALDLFIDAAEGIWHLAGDHALSWAAFARRIAECAGHDPDMVLAVSGALPEWQARRPAYAALGSERTGALGEIEQDLATLVDRHRHHASRAA